MSDARCFGLTLRQPWAWAVGALDKRIENRAWAPSALRVGHDWIAIHAGRSYDSEGGVWIREHFDVCVPSKGALPLGALVAIAQVVDVIDARSPLASDPWFTGPVGWVLDRVTVLPSPIRCRGALGLWTLDEELVGEVRAQLWSGVERVPQPVSSYGAASTVRGRGGGA